MKMDASNEDSAARKRLAGLEAGNEDTTLRRDSRSDLSAILYAEHIQQEDSLGSVSFPCSDSFGATLSSQ